MYLTEKYGRVFPSLEGLAYLARFCRQSVMTALDDLEVLGFITRIRRVRRVQTPLGFKVVQVTNAYRVHEPARGLELLASVLFGNATGSNYQRPSEADFQSKQGNRNKGADADKIAGLPDWASGNLSRAMRAVLGAIRDEADKRGRGRAEGNTSHLNLGQQQVCRNLSRFGSFIVEGTLPFPLVNEVISLPV
jgi:hypothetical protein